MYTARLMQRYANKAQQVVLASAVFDKHGRVLVSPDGLLPSEKITDSFLEKTPQDSFTVAHPLFHWMFQASRNWSSITSIIGGITNHLTHLPHTQRDQTREGIKLITDHGELIENYDIIFRELFCAAASGLADKMKVPLTSVGILWDEIVATGGGGHAAHAQARRRLQDDQATDGDVLGGRKDALQDGMSFEDVEKGMFRQQQHIQEFGRGSLMFLVRRVENARDVEGLAAAGYRFAELHQVSGIIGSTMQIKTRSIENKLRNMASYAEENDMLEPGVHVAFFGVRARVHNDYGFDVLARRNARNLLPSVQMPLARLEAWQINFLRQFERLTPHQIARRLENSKSLTPGEMMFASQLTDSIEALRGWIEDSIFGETVLCAKTVEVPCRPVTLGSSPGTCTVITFKVVIPIHINIESPKCEFVPLNLFKVHQLVYKDSPNHLVFSRLVHREIAPIINAVPLVVTPTKPPMAYSRRASVRDGRMASRIFRVGRPHTSNSTSGSAVDSEGNLIPTDLHRTSSGEGSEKTSSTLKLCERRRSSGDASPVLFSVDSHMARLASPPPAYVMEDFLSPTSTLLSPSASQQQQQNLQQQQQSPQQHQHQLQQLQQPQQTSSFGGIMVSQEITVNVQTAVEVPDSSAGNSSRGNAGRVANRASPLLLRRRTSEGKAPMLAPIVAAGAGLHGDAKSPSRAAHFPGGSSTAGIEMRPMAADRSSVHIGSGIQVSNVEAEKLTEMTTFVDDLFQQVMEGR